ncbi:MAG: c-type cytochrome [Caldimonas sp.]
MKKPLLSPFRAALCAGVAGALLAAGASAQEAKPGDSVAGEKKAAMCIGCHNIPGYQASFPEIYKVPKIAGQNSAYLVTALGEYKIGERKHPSMRAIATTLSSQDMADVAAWYEQLGKGGGESNAAKAQAVVPPADIAALLAKANCQSCHGANFSAPIAPNYPKLAGQHADYLYVALKAYQTDRNALIGRNNQIMMGMARPFTHAELKAMSKYLSALPGDLKTVEQSRFR